MMEIFLILKDILLALVSLVNIFNKGQGDNQIMKIAATISNFIQVSQEQYRDIHITKVFELSSSIDDMLQWAKTIDKNADFHSLLLSVVEDSALDGKKAERSMNCTRCDGTGFLNIDQVPDDIKILAENTDFQEVILDWIKTHDNHDVQVCDCCGDGTGWYGEPGQHYTSDDPIGKNGPYAYNGGLCECH